MRRALAIAALFAGAAARTQAADAIDGVWRGHLGAQPIVACFFGDYGNYYYEAHRRGIELSRDEGLQGYDEGLAQGAATGHWQVAIVDGELRGEWSAPAPARTSLPIRATRVALPDSKVASCGSEAFNAPRFENLPLASKDASQAGVAVTLERVEGTDVTRLRLREPGMAGAAIARVLDAQFRDALASAWDCRVEGGAGEYASTQAVEFADARWLVVRADGGGYCGGAHPDSWSVFYVFERQSGARLDTSAWLKDDNEGLWRLLTERAKPEGECLEAWETGAGFPELRPSKAGLRFDPAFPHVMQACGASVELSLDEARPYLSDGALRALEP